MWRMKLFGSASVLPCQNGASAGLVKMWSSLPRQILNDGEHDSFCVSSSTDDFRPCRYVPNSSLGILRTELYVPPVVVSVLCRLIVPPNRVEIGTWSPATLTSS